MVFIIIGIVLAVAILGGLGAMLAVTYPISKRVYFDNLVRTNPEKWGRVCSAPDNEEQLAMWNSGVEWAEQNRQFVKEVKIQNDGFDLYGEYFDFGGKSCVIILPGRCESLVYSYYFAPPYQRAGFNVLVIDTRCHGKSGGIHNSIGVKESRDVIAWVKFAEETFGIKSFYIHGICIGTSSGLFAMTSKDCPDTVKGLVTEGCYVSFRETFRTHMIADKRPLFPVLDLVMLQIKKHTGTNVYAQKPIRAIKKIKNKRMLFLFGEKDIYSLPKKSQQLFDACACEDKKLVWFDKGGHSHLRINNTEKYDDTIVEFLKYEQ